MDWGVGQQEVAKLTDDVRGDFGIIEAATLTLLSLLIGFSFSMAVDRYNLRKNYEEAEANAIGTEYLRIGLLPAAEVAKVARSAFKLPRPACLVLYRKRQATAADRCPNR